MRPETLLNHIITPTLQYLDTIKPGIDSLAARQFMLAIAAQESHCGSYFKQVQGPAQGIWQVEPATAQDLVTNYLSYRPILHRGISQLLPPARIPDPLIAYPTYCCAIARTLLWRTPDRIPDLNDKDGMWEMYKQYYNTPLGKATRHEWSTNWQLFVDPTIT